MMETIGYALSKERAPSIIEFEDGYKTPRKF